MIEIFTAGYPRSGSTWLGRLLGDLLDSPLQVPGDPAAPLEYFGPGRDGGYVIRKTHLMPNEKPEIGPTVFIHRDPRDVVVSAYFYRGGPQKTNLYDVVESMAAKFPEHPNPIYHIVGVYRQMVEGWLEVADVVTSYEALHSEGPKELMRIAAALGVDTLEFEKCKDVYKRQHFDNFVTKYPHSMRKGIAGDWVSYFDLRCGRRITELLGDLMERQGYIDNLDWWEGLK